LGPARCGPGQGFVARHQESQELTAGRLRFQVDAAG